MHYLSTLLLKVFSLVDALWQVFIQNLKSSLIFCDYAEMFIYPVLSWITSPCFQQCSFQIPDHPAKSLVTTYKSMKICTSDHLFSDRVENQICHLKTFPWRDFSPLFSIRRPLSGVLMILTSILLQCQQFKQNHLETRPSNFPLPLNGHKKLPQRDISVD